MHYHVPVLFTVLLGIKHWVFLLINIYSFVISNNISFISSFPQGQHRMACDAPMLGVMADI